MWWEGLDNTPFNSDVTYCDKEVEEIDESTSAMIIFDCIFVANNNKSQEGGGPPSVFGDCQRRSD